MDELLHGPAVANKLLAEGERDFELIEAVRWHSVGSDRLGRRRAGHSIVPTTLTPSGSSIGKDARDLARAFPPSNR